MSIARVVAWADLRPASLVVSALALRKSLGAEVKVGYSVLASGLRLDIAEGVKHLLEERGVQVDLKEDPGWNRPHDREALVVALLEETGEDGRCQLVLDISGAGPEAAIISLDLARKRWRRPFQVVSFDSGRGTVRIANDPVPEKGLAMELVRFDAGDPAETMPLRAAPVGPGDLLGLYGMRLRPEDPYGLPDGNTVRAAGLLVEAARGVLEAFITDGSGYAHFRGTLASRFHGPAPGPSEVVLEDRDIPAKMRPTMEALKILGLSSVRGGGSPAWILKGPHDRSAVFFLGGGWLEVLVADILTRSFEPPRTVERNAGTLWGRAWTSSSTYAEADAVFVLKNRLFVVSCKNDFLEENLFRHTDRLRALAAEYGETLARPVLVSTRKVEGALENRCRAYEIGHVSGSRLLSILQADAKTESPRRLLSAIQGAYPGPPMPGTGAG